jgi:hypothetical protein
MTAKGKALDKREARLLNDKAGGGLSHQQICDSGKMPERTLRVVVKQFYGSMVITRLKRPLTRRQTYGKTKIHAQTIRIMPDSVHYHLSDMCTKLQPQRRLDSYNFGAGLDYGKIACSKHRSRLNSLNYRRAVSLNQKYRLNCFQTSTTVSTFAL